MEIYNFYNEQYDIKLRLQLDEKRKELSYCSLGIKEEYRGIFRYECKNGWKIISGSGPIIPIDGNVLYLCGLVHKWDSGTVIVSENKHYIKCDVNDDYNTDVYSESYMPFAEIRQLYERIIVALEELGNDYNLSQGQLFLDM